MTDPRPLLFAGIADTVVTASVIAQRGGLITQAAAAAAVAKEIGLTVLRVADERATIVAGDLVLRVAGTPHAIALAEERLVGIMAKPSGIATATREFVEAAGTGLQVVSGAWKKLPFSQKEMIRLAIVAGGAMPRIADWPFAYLDKNFVMMLGGVRATLDAVTARPELRDYRRIIQISRPEEACVAVQAGADIVFVDTGRISDVATVATTLRDAGVRDRAKLAFGGGVTLSDIELIRELDVDIVDVGRAIVDAPLLDMSLRVECGA